MIYYDRIITIRSASIMRDIYKQRFYPLTFQFVKKGIHVFLITLHIFFAINHTTIIIKNRY